MEQDSGIFEYLHTFGDDDHSTVQSSEDSGHPLNADVPAYDFGLFKFEHTPLRLEELFIEDSSLYPRGPFGLYPGFNQDNDNFLLSPLSPLSATLSPISTSSYSEFTTLDSPASSSSSRLTSPPFSRLTSPPVSLPSDSPSSILTSPPESIAMTCCTPADIFCDYDLTEGSNDSVYFGEDDRSDIELDSELERCTSHDLGSPSRPECDQNWRCDEIPLKPYRSLSVTASSSSMNHDEPLTKGCMKMKSSPALFMHPSSSSTNHDDPLLKGSMGMKSSPATSFMNPSSSNLTNHDEPLNKASTKKSRVAKQNVNTPTYTLSNSSLLPSSRSITKAGTSSGARSITPQDGEETEITHRLVASHHRKAKQAVVYREVDSDDEKEFSEYEDSGETFDDEDDYDDEDNYDDENITSRKRRRGGYFHKQQSLSNQYFAPQQRTGKKARLHVDVGGDPPYERSSSEPGPSGSNGGQRKKGTKRKQRRQSSNNRAKKCEKIWKCQECGTTFTRDYDLSRHQLSSCNEFRQEFPCRYCSKPFSRLDACKRHEESDTKQCMMKRWLRILYLYGHNHSAVIGSQLFLIDMKISE
ncbi:hypothetical protein EV361DRAFT_868920 [Lentinula raphanica]|nr:hypothetical protein EV361DRAFT_868920 [Lentinula raphanica]